MKKSLLVAVAIMLVSQPLLANWRSEHDGISPERFEDMAQSAVRTYAFDAGLNFFEGFGPDAETAQVGLHDQCLAYVGELPSKIRDYGFGTRETALSREFIGIFVFERVGVVKVPVRIDGCTLKCRDFKTLEGEHGILCSSGPKAVQAGTAKYSVNWVNIE